MIRKIASKRCGMTTQGYAEHARLSYGHVQKLKRQGQVVTYADRSINAEATDQLRRQTTDPARAGARAVLERPLEAAPAADIDAVKDAASKEGVDVQEGMTYLQARTANEVLKAQERRLRVEKLKGQLVDVAVVKARVFRLAREERDAWLNWPNRVAAVMAAEFGIEPGPFHAALDAEVRRHLNELADAVLKV